MKYFLYKLTRLKVHIVLMCIFAAASYPLFCTAQSDYAAASARYSDAIASGLSAKSPEVKLLDAALADKGATCLFVGIISAVSLVAMFTMGMVILLKCFAYLHRKDVADMEMTAPVSVQTRFFGSFFAGLAVYLIPHIIGAAAGSLLLRGESGYTHLDNVALILRIMMCYGLMMCLLFYCSTAVIAAVCGRMRTVISNTLLMNLAVPVITICAGMLSFRFGYGLGTDLSSEMLNKVGWITPLGLLIEFFANGVLGAEADARLAPAHIVMFLIYCAAFAAAAYFLVKNRRHERTGRTYVFRYTRHVIAGIVVLAVTMFICVNALSDWMSSTYYGVNDQTEIFLIVAYIIVWILVSLGFFSACEFSGSKNEKNRGKRFALFLPYLLASAALTFVVMLTRGFGAVNYVPSVAETKSADLYVNVGAVHLNCEGDEDKSDFIPEIIALHSDIVAGKPEGTGKVSMVYRLKDGATIRRTYALPDEYLERAFELAKKSPSPDVYMWNSVFDEKTAVRAENTPVDDRNIKQSKRFTLKELKDAFSEDIHEMDFGEAKNTDYSDYEMVKIRADGEKVIDHIFIYPICTRTVAVLEKYGLTAKDIFET